MPSVAELISAFQLRRRADTPAYLRGTELAQAGAVRVARVDVHQASAEVEDDGVYAVALRVRGRRLEASCTCAPAPDEVCRHAAAVEHYLWLLMRLPD